VALHRRPAINAIQALLFERRMPDEDVLANPSWRNLVDQGYFTTASEIRFGRRCGAALGISIERESVSWALVTNPTKPTGRGSLSGQVTMPVAPIGEEGKPLPPRLPPEELKQRLAEALATVCAEAPATALAGVGVAWPCVITERGEAAFEDHHPDFAHRDVHADIRQAVEEAGFHTAEGTTKPLPVHFINDADADLLHEARWGRAVGYRNVLGVKVCGQIGGAVLHDGQLMCGANGRAGEINHTRVTWLPWDVLGGGYTDVPLLRRLRRCECEREDCVVRFASGRAIVDTLDDYTGNDYNARGALIHEHASGGHAAARIAAVFLRAGELLGQALESPARLLDPELIVISAFPRHENLAKGIAHTLTPTYKLELRADNIVMATPGPFVTPAGAARLVVEEEIIPLLESASGVRATSKIVRSYDLPSSLRLYIQPRDDDANVATYVHRYRATADEPMPPAAST
jgi:predicted NBD/HSP70 family sugar kinase